VIVQRSLEALPFGLPDSHVPARRYDDLHPEPGLLLSSCFEARCEGLIWSRLSRGPPPFSVLSGHLTVTGAYWQIQSSPDMAFASANVLHSPPPGKRRKAVFQTVFRSGRAVHRSSVRFAHGGCGATPAPCGLAVAMPSLSSRPTHQVSTRPRPRPSHPRPAWPRAKPSASRGSAPYTTKDRTPQRTLRRASPLLRPVVAHSTPSQVAPLSAGWCFCAPPLAGQPMKRMAMRRAV